MDNSNSQAYSATTIAEDEEDRLQRMAVSSTTLISSVTVSGFNSLSSKATTAKLCSFSLPSYSLNNSPKTLKPSVSSSRVFAAPETLNSDETPYPSRETVDGPDSEAFEVESSEMPSYPLLSMVNGADTTAPKQKIRIKLRSYWVPLIEDSCKQIIDAARTTNAKTMGPVPLPAKTRKYCALKSPHVYKDAKFHFETRTHQRLIDILYPTRQTIDSLMKLKLPAGVDVEVKL